MRDFLRSSLVTLVGLTDRVLGYNPIVLSPEQALEKSSVLVRWGDGESSLALGISTPFQQGSLALARELRRIITLRDPRLTLCFPGFLLQPSPFAKLDPRFRSIWALTAILMRLRARKGPYGDALMFRREGDMAGLEVLRSIIQAARQIALVSADPGHADVLARIQPSARIQHVLVPREQAYDKREEIKAKIIATGEPDLLLLSAGPTGKCLAVELMAKWHGLKIIDTGHFFDHSIIKLDKK